MHKNGVDSHGRCWTKEARRNKDMLIEPSTQMKLINGDKRYNTGYFGSGDGQSLTRKGWWKIQYHFIWVLDEALARGRMGCVGPWRCLPPPCRAHIRCCPPLWTRVPREVGLLHVHKGRDSEAVTSVRQQHIPRLSHPAYVKEVVLFACLLIEELIFKFNLMLWRG